MGNWVFYFKNKHSEFERVEVLCIFLEGYLKFCNFKNRLRFNVHKFIQTKFTIEKYSSVQGFHLLMWTSIGSYQCKYQWHKLIRHRSDFIQAWLLILGIQSVTSIQFEKLDLFSWLEFSGHLYFWINLWTLKTIIPLIPCLKLHNWI